MKHPYRSAGEISNSKLRRRAAFWRGVWRRIVVPTQVMCLLGGILTGGNVIIWAESKNLRSIRDIETARHYEDWDRSISNRQKVADEHEADLKRRENELNVRVQTFETIMTMTAGVSNKEFNQKMIDAASKLGVKTNEGKKE